MQPILSRVNVIRDGADWMLTVSSLTIDMPAWASRTASARRDVTDGALSGQAAAWGHGISANRYAFLELQGFPRRETSLIEEMKVA
ncbi:hypothetical protein [Paraburkholderia ginsengiterrae]|uniref:hypothetical protein n=1 Tax=Paraburkholderia ginsengiterrae TaxID=1462993 RepID=UPI0012FCDE4E|nr:hypothetical protein [Paraburkholderia ginsengiterrae]